MKSYDAQNYAQKSRVAEELPFLGDHPHGVIQRFRSRPEHQTFADRYFECPMQAMAGSLILRPGKLGDHYSKSGDYYLVMPSWARAGNTYQCSFMRDGENGQISDPRFPRVHNRHDPFYQQQFTETCVDNILAYRMPGKSGHAELRFEDDSIVYNDPGLLSLKGTSLPHGVYYLNSRRLDDGNRTAVVLQAITYYQVEGTYFDEPVFGVMSFDRVYFSDALFPDVMARGDRAMLEVFEGDWICGVNWFDDGSVEFMDIAVGGRINTLHGAQIVDEKTGAAHVTSNVELVSRTLKDFGGMKAIHSVTYKVDGELWEFEPHGNGTMSDPRELAQTKVHSWNLGTLTRSGEKRKLLNALAFQGTTFSVASDPTGGG